MKNLAKRNSEEKLCNHIKCGICKKEFQWTEGENAEVIVDRILYDGGKDTLILDVIVKCPYCGYKVKYRQETVDDRYK